MADSEILFVVKADNKQAVDALNKVSQSFEGVTQKTKTLAGATNNSNMMLMSTSRIVQDLPFGFMAVGNNITFLAEQMAFARSQGTSLGAMFKGMLSSLMGTGGIVFGISLLTSGLTYLSMQSSKTNEKIEEFSDVIDKAKRSVKSLRDEIGKLREKQQEAATPSFFDWLFAGGNVAQATANKMKGSDYISATNQLRVLDEYQRKMRGFAQEIIANGKNIGNVVRDNMLKRPDLEYIADYLKEELDKIPMVSSYYRQYADALAEVNKQLDLNVKKKKELGPPVSGVPQPYGVMGVSSSLPPEFGNRFGMKGVRVPGTTGIEYIAEDVRIIIAENKYLIDSIIAAADVLRDEFISAWEDIFGEANSLFEKLMANIVSSIASNFAMDLAGGFLNMIVPGLGTALSLAGAGSGSILGKTQINLQMDNETMATWYVGGMEQASRLRKI